MLKAYDFNKFLKEEKLIEMATIGSLNDLTIQVYTDHLPKHFHVVKKDKFEVRLSIKDLSIISYKWQKGSSEITAKEIDKLRAWLDKPNNSDKTLTNKSAIVFAWKIMNKGN